MGEAEHASVGTYWKICIILCVATFIEWVIFHIETLSKSAAFMYPVLTILSVGKFFLVVGYYMHLKYDNKILSQCFYFSMALAGLVFAIYLMVM